MSQPVSSTLHLVIWGLLVIPSVTLFCFTDAFQIYSPVFPFGPTLFLALLFHSAIPLFVTYVGMIRYPQEYKVFQPFQGGFHFVLWQVIGYLNWTLVIVVSNAYLWVRKIENERTRHGVLASCGVMSLISGLFLFQSLKFFQAPSAMKRPNSKSPTGMWFLASSPNAETAVVIAVCVGSLLLCGLAEYSPTLQHPIAMILLASHVFSGVLTHFVVGWKWTKNYHLFMPFHGSVKSVVASAFGWFAFSVTTMLGFMLYSFTNVHSSVSPSGVVSTVQPPPYSFLFIGFCSTASIGCLLGYIRLFHLKAGPGSASSLSRHGCFVLSVISGASCLLALGVIVVKSPTFMKALQAQLQSVPISLWLEKVSVYVDAFNACKALASYTVLFTPPITHAVGSIRHGDFYEVWQPFSGRPDFVALQAVGWTLYGFAALFAILNLTAIDSFWELIGLTSALLAQLIIHLSVKIFKPTPSSAISSRHQRGDSNLSDSYIAPSPSLSSWKYLRFFNGEFMVAVMLSFSSLILMVVSDVMVNREEFPRAKMMMLAVLVYAVATPLAHLSGRNVVHRIFQPFKGCAEYVALQAVGWTLYAILFILSLVTVYASGQHYSYVHSFQGVFNQLPFIFIAASMYFEEWAHSTNSDSPLSERLTFPSPSSGRLSPQPGPSTHCLWSAEDIKEMKELLSKCKQKRVRELLQGHCNSFSSAGPSPIDNLDNTPLSTLQYPKEKSTRVVTVIVFLFCLSVVVLHFAAASFYIQSDSRPVGLVLLACSLGATVLSCTGTHCFYGPAVHDGYRIWMPFDGGSLFVTLQGLGWMSFASEIGISLQLLLQPPPGTAADEMRELAVKGLFVVAATLGIVAQVTILASIRNFHYIHGRSSFFARNAEGTLSVVLCFGALAMMWMYENFNAGGERVANADVSLSAPMILAFGSLTLALPLAVMGLKKSSQEWASDQLEYQQKGGAPSSAPFLALEFVVATFAVVLPMLMLYAGYFLINCYAPGIVLILLSSKTIAWLMPCLLTVTILSRSADRLLPNWFINFRCAFVCINFYMIPTWMALAIYLSPILLKTRGTMSLLLDIHCITLLPRFLIPSYKGLRVLYCLSLLYHHVKHGYEVYLTAVLAGTNSAEAVLISTLTLQLLEDIFVNYVFFVYERTYRGTPEETGMRRSERISDWMCRNIFADIERYFSFDILVDDNRSSFEKKKACLLLDEPGKNYVCGFHPHGIFPITCIWAFLTDRWKEKVGSKCPVTGHAASIVFLGPVLRDITMWCGGRVVTKKSIQRSLREGNSTVIVPGGQAEMILSAVSQKEVRVVTKHQGFIRLAIQEGKPLLPIYCFGEHNILDNIHCHSVQKFFLSIVGVGFPVLPIGRWYLPFPVAVKVTLAVGSPVSVPSLPSITSESDKKGEVQIPEDILEDVTNRYYAELLRIFENNKVAAGYPNLQLRLEPRKGKQGESDAKGQQGVSPKRRKKND